MSSRTLAAAVAVLAAIGGTAWLGSSFPETITSAPDPEPAVGQLDERSFVCPVLGRSADAAESVTVLGLTGPSAAEPAGQITGVPGAPVPLPAPGTSTVVRPAAAGGTVTVLARGDSAATTGVVRGYLDPREEGRGLAMAMCQAPRSRWWFVGVSAQAGQIDELLLSNPTDSPAVASVDVFGVAGPIDVVGASGVVIQPGEQVTIRVDSLIPGTQVATLRVETSGGLVSAALRSTSIDGLIPQGAEYIPAAAEPAETVVVPGVLGGAGGRRLLLTAGGQDAAAEVTLITPEGGVDAGTVGQVPIPAATTVALDLDEVLKGRPAVVLIESSAPVTAGAVSVVAGTVPAGATGVLNRVPVADTAWTAAAPGITDRWLLPLTGAIDAPGRLLLSAPEGTATVDVVVHSSAGIVFRRTVDLKAQRLQDIAVPVTGGSSSVVEVILVEGGPVSAATYQAGSVGDGPLAAAATGLDPSTEVQLPVAYPQAQVLTGAGG